MKIHSAAAVLAVSDLDASLAYYTSVLGFEEDFRFGQYAGIKRDDCCVHLNAYGLPDTPAPGSGSVYLSYDAVDDYYADIVARGAPTNGEPQDYEYGMRDFITRDPDGNQLSFGAPVAG